MNIVEIKEQLTNLGYFWVGADLTASRDYHLADAISDPLTLELAPGSLPPIDCEPQDLLENVGEVFGLSVRSRLGQAGLDVSPYTLHNEGYKIGVVPYVLGRRPIKIREGEGVLSLASDAGAELLKGRELWRAVNDKDQIVIEDEYGRDWFFTDIGNLPIEREADMDRADGIGLRFNSNRFRIRPEDGEIEVTRDLDYRGWLDREILEQMAPQQLDNFMVVETISKVTLPQGYNGLLIFLGFIGGVPYIQTASCLVRGGHTDWPLRCELKNVLPRTIDANGFFPGVDLTAPHIRMLVFRDRNLGGADLKSAISPRK